MRQTSASSPAFITNGSYPSKSRNGCKTCRGRRVKCDEVHPICANCLRRELTCIYDPGPAAPPPPRIEVQSLLSSPNPPLLYTQSATKHEHSTTYNFLSLFSRVISPSPPLSSPALDLTHLELLHHYSTSTYSTFSVHEGWQLVWRDKVPRLGFQYPFVLHATLAITALHLSVLNYARSEHYQVLAAGYYHEASVAFREAIPHRDSLESNALFVASSFIAIYVFACPSVQKDKDDPRALTWFPVLRGIRAVIQGQWGKIASELAPSLFGAAPSGVSALPPLLPLDQLYSDLEDPDERELYLDAEQKLRTAWDIYRGASGEFWLAAAFMWPVTIGEKFLQLLVERRPRALVLLAHHSAMFSMLAGFWWIGDRAREELAVIERVVGEEWSREWLHWVKNVIG